MTSLAEYLDEAERIAQSETMMLPTVEHVIAQNKRIKELERKLSELTSEPTEYLAEAVQ
jgi:hypothetical protein